MTARHRPPAGKSWYSGLALLLALATSGVLLSLPTPQVDTGPPTLATVWKNARPSSAPLQLADGTGYSPLIYFDAQTALGTAPTRDGTAVRLLLRVGNNPPTELRRLATSLNPQWSAFTASGDDVVWAEWTAPTQGRAETRLWRGSWRHPGVVPVSLTADTGEILFFNSSYDLVVNGGRVYWASAAPSAQPQTEIRWVPLSGGPNTAATVRVIAGGYSLSAWPWLISASSGPSAAIELLNLDSGQRIRVPASSTELVTCSPAWCRTLVLSASTGPVRLDMMRPDGSDRRRVAGSMASAAVQDVGLLDRFEVVSQASSTGSLASQQLFIYDTVHAKLVRVANGVGIVQARGAMLWWSTGDNDTLEWHALDLRTLT